MWNNPGSFENVPTLSPSHGDHEIFTTEPSVLNIFPSSQNPPPKPTANRPLRKGPTTEVDAMHTKLHPYQGIGGSICVGKWDVFFFFRPNFFLQDFSIFLGGGELRLEKKWMSGGGMKVVYLKWVGWYFWGNFPWIIVREVWVGTKDRPLLSRQRVPESTLHSWAICVGMIFSLIFYFFFGAPVVLGLKRTLIGSW